jgi:hypothetical protein
MTGTGGMVTSHCASGVSGASAVPVTGSLRGLSVDAMVSDQRLVTSFLGPGASATSPYGQSFDVAGTTPEGAFVFRAPADVVTASFEGWAGAAAAEVGTYSPMGGFFVFELAFPIPSGVVCPSRFGNCGPLCASVGEAGICTPTNPRVRYSTLDEASSSGMAASADWQLQLDSVCPRPSNGTLINFETHGRLSATLVNETDASDTVEVNLDF